MTSAVQTAPPVTRIAEDWTGLLAKLYDAFRDIATTPGLDSVDVRFGFWIIRCEREPYNASEKCQVTVMSALSPSFFERFVDDVLAGERTTWRVRSRLTRACFTATRGQ